MWSKIILGDSGILYVLVGKAEDFYQWWILIIVLLKKVWNITITIQLPSHHLKWLSCDSHMIIDMNYVKIINNNNANHKTTDIIWFSHDT